MRFVYDDLTFLVLGASCLCGFNFLMYSEENFRMLFNQSVSPYLSLIYFIVSLVALLLMHYLEWKAKKRYIQYANMYLLGTSIVAIPIMLLSTGYELRIGVLCTLAVCHAVAAAVLGASVFKLVAKYDKECLDMISSGNSVASITLCSLDAAYLRTSLKGKEIATYLVTCGFSILAIIAYRWRNHPSERDPDDTLPEYFPDSFTREWNNVIMLGVAFGTSSYLNTVCTIGSTEWITPTFLLYNITDLIGKVLHSYIPDKVQAATTAIRLIIALALTFIHKMHLPVPSVERAIIVLGGAFGLTNGMCMTGSFARSSNLLLTQSSLLGGFICGTALGILRLKYFN